MILHISLLVIAAALLRIWLNVRQLASLKWQLAAPAPPWGDALSFETAVRGGISRVRVAFLSIVAEAIVVLALATDVIPRLSQIGIKAGVPEVMLAVMLGALALVSLGAIKKLSEAASIYVVDAKLGLGVPSPRLFLADTATRMLVSSITALPLLAIAAALMQTGSPLWWIGAWGLWALALSGNFYLRPILETRLFHSATALNDMRFARAIATLLRRCGLSLSDVQVLDASRRSKRANASVHGFGRKKHILLFDTLFERLSRNEILAVVAHEAGHARKGHALQYFGALALAGFGAAAAFAAMREGIGSSPAAQLGIFVLLLPSLGVVVKPVLARMLRRFEYEADAFAAMHVNGQAMIGALESLYAANANVPESDPFYAAFYASHPEPRERLSGLGKNWPVNSSADRTETNASGLSV